MNLCEAADYNQIEEVRRLLSEGADVDAKIESAMRESGWNPLHLAVYRGNTEVVKLLITSGANLDYRDKNGYTPLHNTVWSVRMKEAELLLNSGANPNAKDKWGRTPLHLAALKKGKQKEFMEFLISKGVDLNLVVAACLGKKDIVKLLISNGENVNTKDLDEDCTPLHMALRNAHEDIAKLLITEGADVNASDRDGKKPLHLAVMEGFVKVVELLIVKGANVNCQDQDDHYPLHHAALYGQKEIVKLLIAKGANVNSMDRKGNKPLDFAGSKSDVVNLLLKYGARR